jgi:uncharacterized membrane protein
MLTVKPIILVICVVITAFALLVIMSSAAPFATRYDGEGAVLYVGIVLIVVALLNLVTWWDDKSAVGQVVTFLAGVSGGGGVCMLALANVYALRKVLGL